MLHWIIVFVVIAGIASVLGFGKLAFISVKIARFLIVILLVVLAIFALRHFLS